MRRNADFAQAREFVTPHKQRRIRLAAESWLEANPTKKQPRFDVMEVYAPDGIATKTPEFEFFENAF